MKKHHLGYTYPAWKNETKQVINFLINILHYVQKDLSTLTKHYQFVYNKQLFSALDFLVSNNQKSINKTGLDMEKMNPDSYNMAKSINQCV